MKSMTRSIILSLLGLTLALLPGNANAHEPDHTYVFLKIYKEGIEGRFELTATDLNRELGLNLAEVISDADLKPHIPRIHDFLKANVSFSAAGVSYPLRLTGSEVLLLDEEDDYIIFNFKLENVTTIPNQLDIVYDIFFKNNPNHKGVLIVEHNWKAGIVNNHSLVADVFTKGETSKQLSLQDASLWKGFVAMVKLGMWHIWIGLDHILFLVALILPSVVRRRKKDVLPELENETGVAYSDVWIPVPKFKPAALYLLKIVTFFTIAHSITLAIAALGVFDLPSRYVESVIAFSIALAALHNIVPIVKSREWVIAFAFGLFHGFGFASVLGEKGLGGEFMTLSLLGFNVGVEIGQVLIISSFFPILFFIRKLKLYPKLLTYGSVILILISLHWVIERFFEINIPLGRFLDSFLG